MKRFSVFILFILVISACNQESKFDLIITNAKVYTVNPAQEWAEAIGIKDGKIVFVGSNDELKKQSTGTENTLDCAGQFLMPGFIEGHGHFAGVGEMLLNLNLLHSKSWEQIINQVEAKVATSKPGEWIEGRGWHQEKWDSVNIRNINGYPMHQALSKISPDNPVILYHASGHSLFANSKAMEESKVSKETEAPMGGEIIRDADGDAIGVFEERAMNLISRSFSKYEADLGKDQIEAKWYKGLELAQEECLQKGITSFQDAGSYFSDIDKYSQLAKEGKLNIRLWVMIRESAEKMKGELKNIRQVGTGNNYFTCRAIKSELDGALGSFGAWLLEPYNDKKGFYGQNTTEIEELEEIAELAQANDMQLCIHAIGDRGNRESLDVIEKFTPTKKDHRWRIEHAQHLSTADIKRFKTTGTIASMQAIHCTSDSPFVEKRLGNKRSKEGAYAWRSLLDAGAIVTNGTDAPVEDVDPIPCFYASVTRKRADNGFEFFTEQSMTRSEAIKSYTLSNAHAAFEEGIKGSIEIGKLADLVLLDKDLINCDDKDILQTKVLWTMVDGQIKFKNQD